ncbi:MAG TPA: ABC transporter ATP-binding protein [Anaerolineae bacterium]|nr:ABC transporter ATP-binding protein [Anaerolineae bacterium]
MAAIRFENVSKRFLLHHERTRSLQDLFVRKLSARKRQQDTVEEFWALRDVSFEVPTGEMVGLVGPNGAGKSTILKLLARIIEPTSGKVSINGRLNALIELSAGFHEELTGRENIFLSAALLGLSRADIRKQLDEIIAFSELEKFIDTPVKHYSSGMHMRLGFAIATVIESEVLLVDEVLAVGDAAFQRKCFERIAEIRERGTTILFVSHQMADVERNCDRALLIMNGRLTADGAPDEVAQRYKELSKRQRTDVPDFYNVEYMGWDVPEEMCVGERAKFSVTIRNNSHEVWNGEQGSGTRLVSLSYHWLDRFGNMHQFMAPRKILPRNLPPDQVITLENFILPPTQPGTYLFEIDLAVEGLGWFGAHGRPGPQIMVQVLPERRAQHNGDGNENEMSVAAVLNRK